MCNLNERNSLVKTYRLLGTVISARSTKNAQNEVLTVMC